MYTINEFQVKIVHSFILCEKILIKIMKYKTMIIIWVYVHFMCQIQREWDKCLSIHYKLVLKYGKCISVCLTQFSELCEPLSSNLPDLSPSVKDRKRLHLCSHSPVVPKIKTNYRYMYTIYIPVFFFLFFKSVLALSMNIHVPWYVHGLVENLHVPCHML